MFDWQSFALITRSLLLMKWTAFLNLATTGVTDQIGPAGLLGLFHIRASRKDTWTLKHPHKLPVTSVLSTVRLRGPEMKTFLFIREPNQTSCIRMLQIYNNKHQSVCQSSRSMRKYSVISSRHSFTNKYRARVFCTHKNDFKLWT